MHDAIIADRFEASGDPLDRTIVRETGAGTRCTRTSPTVAADGSMVDGMVIG